MNLILKLTPQDPLVARDGRPFGVNQGQRMRGLPWLLPSVVAGSFRTALVKAGDGLDFSDKMPDELLQIEVAGVLPVHKPDKAEPVLYLPAPGDAVAQPEESGLEIKQVHRTTPQPLEPGCGCDFPDGLPLQPVMLPAEADTGFKPTDSPAWWPLSRMVKWLTQNKQATYESSSESPFFDSTFLTNPQQQLRDHVCLDAERGAAAESLIFATSGLDVTRMPRFAAKQEEKLSLLRDYAEITLTARVTLPEGKFNHASELNIWHPLGGERRLVHWSHDGNSKLWDCPSEIRTALQNADRVRMILATPAIFESGWKPGWLKEGRKGTVPGTDVNLELVGVSNQRWKAVSGWSMKPHQETGKPGPKAIRRMVPAGSVYFFQCQPGAAAALAERWLHSVSDDPREQRDGFGLAAWGIW